MRQLQFIQAIMSIPQVDRLLFAQGGLCFFCTAPLAHGVATVEHLDARANGGGNGDGNCVACCSEINSLLGSMSLKEKIRVVLNQKSKFVCPKNALTKTKSAPVSNPPDPAKPTRQYTIVLAHLIKRGASKPRKVEGLKNLIRTIAAGPKKALPESELDSLLGELQRTGKILITDTRVSYSLE